MIFDLAPQRFNAIEVRAVRVRRISWLAVYRLSFARLLSTLETTTGSGDGAQMYTGPGRNRTGWLSGCQDLYGGPDNPRHLGGANYLAADGHVKWLPASKVSQGHNTGTDSNQAEGTCAQELAAGTANMGSRALTFSVR